MAEKLTSNDKDILKDFGGRLNTLLERYNLTQKEFAQEIKVSPYMVSLWIKNKSNITLTSLYKIIDFFHDSYPNSNPVLHLLPDFIGNEYTNMWEIQRTNILKRLESTCKKFDYSLLNDLGIEHWADLFESPFECDVNKILKN